VRKRSNARWVEEYHVYGDLVSIEYLEFILRNPPANRPVSLKAPSDTKAAFQALAGHVEGLDRTR
jgi:hypothetical protein